MEVQIRYWRPEGTMQAAYEVYKTEWHPCGVLLDDHYKCDFAVDREAGTACLGVWQLQQQADGKWGFGLFKKLLEHEAGNIGEYADWLAERVDSIRTDGMLFWSGEDYLRSHDGLAEGW